jgi:hypothetical protein
LALMSAALIAIFASSSKPSQGFAPEERQVIKALLEGMILKHEAKRWSSAA